MKVNNPLIPKFPIKLNSLEEYNDCIKANINGKVKQSKGFIWWFK